MALVRPPRWTVAQLFRGQSLTVILDGLQDPGNVGAIAGCRSFWRNRSGVPEGYGQPLQSEMLRASAGSISAFHWGRDG